VTTLLRRLVGRYVGRSARRAGGTKKPVKAGTRTAVIRKQKPREGAFRKERVR
jgi:hypothetical protein